MKTITKIFVLGLLLFPMCAFAQKATEQRATTVYAQNEQRSDTFSAGLSFGVSGDYVYHCTYNEIGKKILNGPFTMKGDLTMDNIRVNYRTNGSVTVNHTLSGAHDMGCINGPMLMSATVKAKLTNGSTQTDTYSFKGNFKEGYPNGTFAVNYKEGNLVRMANVTYRDSIFVGSYHCKGLDNNNWEYEYKGSFTSDGKLTGTWNLNKNVYYFLNGVKVSGYDERLGELAKKYAAGSMSKEELSDKGYYVCTDSLDLGYKAWSIILSDEIHWKRLGFYSFSKTEFIKYEYLKELPRISDHGVNKLIYNLKKAIEVNNSYNVYDGEIDLPFTDMRSTDLSEFAHHVRYDPKYDQHYITVWRNSSYQDYCSGGSIAEELRTSVMINVYLTKDQFDKIAFEIHEFQKQHVKNKQEFIKLVSPSNIVPKNFAYCQYDSNYATYDCIQHKMRFYVDIDMAEEYMISCGKYEYVLKHAPSGRKEKLMPMLNEAMAAALKSVKNTVNNNLMSYINEQKKGQSESVLRSRYFVNSPIHDKYFPINSYGVYDYELVGDIDNPDVKYKAKFKFNVLRGENDYHSYETVLFINDKAQILCDLTFDPKWLKEVSTPFDEVSELSSTFQQRANAIESLANGKFPKSWTEIDRYLKGYNLNIDYKDPAGTLKRYKIYDQSLTDIMLYLKGLVDIKSMYENISSKYGNYASDIQSYVEHLRSNTKPWTTICQYSDLQKLLEINANTLSFFENLDKIKHLDQKIILSGNSKIIKPYSEWFKTKNFSWTPVYKKDYFENLVSTLSDTYEFTEKQLLINTNVAKLKELRSASKIINKLYTDYYKSVDLSWNEDTEILMEKYDELLSIQKDCITILSREDIAIISSEITNSGMSAITQVIGIYGSAN